MKPRIAIAAAFCLVLIFSLWASGTLTPTTTTAQMADAAETHPVDPDRASRSENRYVTTTTIDTSWMTLPPITTTIPPTTTTVAPTTTAAPTTTTTAKPKPKPTTTTTKAPAPPVTAASSGDSRRWMSLISQYDWDTEHAYRIMMCESGGNPNAINRSSGATGLFQIHPGGSKYLDPATNVATAYAKYKASGWRPWVCKA